MAIITNPILDFIAAKGSENRVIDLSTIFAGEGLTYQIESSNPDIATLTVADDMLTIDFLETISYSDVTITATDASGQSVTDNVRIRVAGENAFTVAVMPDTQSYTSIASINHTFGNMTEWLVSNKDSLNIQFVTHVGDITQNNNAANWSVAEEALRKLDGEIPYSLAPGNHDQSLGGRASDHSTDYLDSLFSPESQATVNPDTWGGNYDQDPDSSANTYHTFTAPDGTKWMVLSLEFGIREDVLRWAGDVIEDHSDHRIMITSHSLTNFAGRHDPLGYPVFAEGAGYDYGMGNEPAKATDGEDLWRELASRYPNVAMTFSGHIFGDGAETVTSYNQYGEPVYQMLVNYQNGVAREVTGNGDASLGSLGGNGAIRLVTIDPENGAIYTQTYFTELDSYLTSGREDGDLAGTYAEHEEVMTGLNLGPVVPRVMAHAGDDIYLNMAEDASSLTVMLDAIKTINSTDDDVEYRWLDRDGNVLATGPQAPVDLTTGKHLITLEIKDASGQITRDETMVMVSGPRTLFAENFNDGDAAGWTVVRPLLAQATTFETASQAGAPALAGGDAGVMTIPALEGSQAYHVDPGFEPSNGDNFTSYTMIMDLMVHDGNGEYFSLFQNDMTNSEDGAIFIENEGDGTGTLEILRGAHGTITYGKWHRIALTVEDAGDGTVTLKKFIDGALVGTQNVPAERLTIDGENGFLLFADDNGESGVAHINSLVFTDRVMTDAEIIGHGGPTAAGLQIADDARSLQFDFDNGLEPDVGTGTITIIDPKGDALSALAEFGTAADLGVSAVPGGEDQIIYVPAPKENQGMIVMPSSDADSLRSYTLVMDIYVPSGQGRYLSLLQTDLENDSDGDIFIRTRSDGTAELGGGGYDGSFAYDQWQRIAMVVEEQADGTLSLHKYINGTLIGTRADIDADRFTVDGDGFYILTDNDGEMVDSYLNGVMFSERAFSADEITAIGGVSTGGILADAPDTQTTQFDFSGDLMASFGNATLNFRDESDVGLWQVKGSVHSRVEGIEGLDAPEGELTYGFGNADKTLVWNAPEALSWSNYVYDVTLRSSDDDTIGVLFYFTDESNHYRVEMDAEHNTRKLIKVTDGVETVMAEVVGGYRFNDDMEMRVAVVNGAITVLLDNQDMFGGAVRDGQPLSGGTVGVYTSHQKSAVFDDLMVNTAVLTAHGASNTRSIDTDANGYGAVSLSAEASFGPDDMASFRWLLDGVEIARGREVEIDLPVGTTGITLEVTDATGEVSTDFVKLDIVGADRVLFSEGFDSTDLSAWTIVDEGDLGGPSDWQVQDGRLYQNSDIHSQQLTWSSASNSDPWQQGWSPLGDGVNALRKGTYALYNAPEAMEWTNYSVETTIETPDNDGIGILLHYQDTQNYYKMELDQEGGLWQLRSMVDGYEKTLAQMPARYTSNEPIQLRVDIYEGQMMAYVNDMAIFAYTIQNMDLDTGTFGLYSWGSEGVSFDDVTVVEMRDTANANIAPVADSDHVQTRAGEALFIAAATVLANDTDANGDSLILSSVRAIEGGEVSLESNEIHFTPAEGFIGTARFSYTLTDGWGAETEAEVTVAVVPQGGVVTATSAGGALNGHTEIGTMLIGAEADDHVFGGKGDDWFMTGAGNDYASGMLGNDHINGGEGDDMLVGGLGDDTLDGGTGNDVLSGGHGSDLILGGAGNDSLFGGEGRDTLIAGANDDWLSGGHGADTFVFAPAGGHNVVVDFTSGEDLIDLATFTTIQNFSDLAAAITEIDDGVQLQLDAETIVELRGLDRDDLVADDFRFA